MTTGNPLAWASINTIGNPSKLDGKKNTSSKFNISPIFVFNPVKITLSATPYCSAKFCKKAVSPLPIKTKREFGSFLTISENTFTQKL